MSVYRCFTEKRKPYDTEAETLLRELRGLPGIKSIESLRILNRYDIEGITGSTYRAARETVFSEPQADEIYDEAPPGIGGNCRTLVIESLPGQYDQRADSCIQCLRLLDEQANAEFRMQNSEFYNTIIIKTAKMYVFGGIISDSDMDKIRSYMINPVESREASHEKPESLAENYPDPKPVETLHGFIAENDDDLLKYLHDYSLAMDIADLRSLQSYFRDTEKRNPTMTELRMVDTYWSDHCRHTTFFTHITDITIDDPNVRSAYDAYLAARREIYGGDADDRPQTLMDIATISAKVLRKRGMLANIDISEEVNACSIHIDANVGGKTEDWLLMFKNETHNHPTEAEPFGGAATCIGGAIRDPMSGRAHVYQAMRITGAGDPRAAFEDTLPGKLPQRKLTNTAARGYSSYGNQIGLSAGFVHEIYHPGYIAKRMELGAVVGAVKAENVRRETPVPGDKVLLLGGRTGRDGIGGATGSSKSQTEKSIGTLAAEVQKGNAAEERKIQRLFLDPEVIRMIKKCNDFGAGGVSVAVGELADGLEIDLSLVRCKYGGLDGTEIAISESQERMAVVVSSEDTESFIKKALDENLEAYVIAEVTGSPRVIMRHGGKIIVDISREFLSTNGAVKTASVRVPPLTNVESSMQNAELSDNGYTAFKYCTNNTGTSDMELNTLLSPLSTVDRLRAMVEDLRYCSQRGLYEMFDGMAGALSILEKNGGRTKSTPIQVMASLLPVWDNETTTASVMAYGYDPFLSSENPFIGAKTAVVTSVAKLVAAGCDPDAVYLTFQEYFERLNHDPLRWGKPFSALLGAFEAQMELGLAAIGGKDSMSGSYNDIDVPPALVSFAIAPNEAAHIISPEFKKAGHDIILFRSSGDPGTTKKTWKKIYNLIKSKTIISAWAATDGGAAEGLFKMALGNEIGFEYTADCDPDILFSYAPGAIIAEMASSAPDTTEIPGALKIGRTITAPAITIKGKTISIADLKAMWENVLEPIFPTKSGESGGVPAISYSTRSIIAAGEHFSKPRAMVFAFPGSNSEYDTARAVSRAGGIPKIFVVRNMTPAMLYATVAEAVREMAKSQILIISGGYAYGDEPDGAAKFMSLFFRNPLISDATSEHLEIRGGLMLGICNGFQAFIKLGLVPYGKIMAPCADAPTLIQNAIGRYQAGYVYTRVASVSSPWMSLCNIGDIHAMSISHGEGRFIAADSMLQELASRGQIATQYSDVNGAPSMDTIINPNGSIMAVEGLFSPDGRVFGKMCLTERYGEHVAKNIYGEKHQPIFESGIKYFK